MNLGSSIFLVVSGTLFLLFFGLPLLISPMFWARMIGWDIPEDKNLANYLGRSLGGVIIPVIIVSFMAARNPYEFRIIFTLVILVGIFEAFVHLYGFIKKTQPLVEHLEIIMYSVLAFLAWYFYPVPPM